MKLTENAAIIAIAAAIIFSVAVTTVVLTNGTGFSQTPAGMIEVQDEVLSSRMSGKVLGLDLNGNGIIEDSEPRSVTQRYGDNAITITRDGTSLTVSWSRYEDSGDDDIKSVRRVLIESLETSTSLRELELHDGTVMRECSHDGSKWRPCG